MLVHTDICPYFLPILKDAQQEYSVALRVEKRQSKCNRDRQAGRERERERGRENEIYMRD